MKPLFHFIAILSIGLSVFIIGCRDEATKPQPEPPESSSSADSISSSDEMSSSSESSSSVNPVGELLTEAPNGFFIQLDVKSDGWGNHLGTWYATQPGTYTLDVQESEPYNGNNTQYSIKASAQGYWSELIDSEADAPFRADLDRIVPEGSLISEGFAGIMIGHQTYFGDCIAPNLNINWTSPSGREETGSTDSLGRFWVVTQESGIWHGEFEYEYATIQVEVNNMVGFTYTDVVFNEPMIARAPNIYLYPTTTTQVQVTLDFPEGTGLATSLPAYNEGWNVWVNPEGLIDEQYGYLFYENSSFPELQTETGWLVDGNNLSSELARLLELQGFQGSEITDFLEFWLPVLPEFPWYQITPQNPELSATLEINPAPESLLRILWHIRPLPIPVELTAPQIQPFERNGFTVVEWGVLTPPITL
jgi:hypothetical protein